jgi:outer membrane protein OmpA-like peptidoglycan-associated protein
MTTFYIRNGVEIITTRDRYGDIITRVKRLRNGREIVLIDNRYPDDYDPRRDVIIRDVPPPRVRIPDDEYIVDLGEASYDDIRGALLAPPVAELERPYTLDEVLRNEQVRAYSPRIDLDTITFDLGSATIGSDQMRSLAYLGQALADVIAENPDEVYLIEGHTDRVGSNYDNLILSDRRAEAVAVALSQNFEIPPENLVTEGYGEEYPKIDTDKAERRNRRATVRRVTDLLQAQNQ